VKCPIYTYKSILDDAGIQYEENETMEVQSEDNDPKESDNQENLNQLTIDDLNIELEKALKIEDYARAALLRDEIKTRK
jgi:protein-arginine kinase activator protein McsA